MNKGNHVYQILAIEAICASSFLSTWREMHWSINARVTQISVFISASLCWTVCACNSSPKCLITLVIAYGIVSVVPASLKGFCHTLCAASSSVWSLQTCTRRERKRESRSLVVPAAVHSLGRRILCSLDRVKHWPADGPPRRIERPCPTFHNRRNMRRWGENNYPRIVCLLLWSCWGWHHFIDYDYVTSSLTNAFNPIFFMSQLFWKPGVPLSTRKRLIPCAGDFACLSVTATTITTSQSQPFDIKHFEPLRM